MFGWVKLELTDGWRSWWRSSVAETLPLAPARQEAVEQVPVPVPTAGRVKEEALVGVS